MCFRLAAARCAALLPTANLHHLSHGPLLTGMMHTCREQEDLKVFPEPLARDFFEHDGYAGNYLHHKVCCKHETMPCAVAT